MSATECVRAAEVEAALDERLPEPEARGALQHARTCARCREVHGELTALRGLVARLPDAAPDELASRRMRASVLGAVLRPAPVVRRGYTATFALAAAALALVVFGVRSVRRPTERVTAGRADAAVGTAASPAAISLGGAGTLWPAADARVFVRSAGSSTHIELSAGRIDLQVTHRRAGERFVVTTGDAEVEVRGTRFQVEAREGHLRRVDVSEGVVAVRCEGEAERLLVAGAHLVLPEETRAEPAPVAPAQVVTPPAPERPPAARPDPGAAFRAGSLAFVQGDHAVAAESLQRFLAQSSRADPRREDARYVLVLALHAARREAEMERAAWAFLAEFPRGLRRAEVVVALVRSLAGRGDCDDAARAAMALPEDADARFRAPVTRALQACR